MVIPFRHYIEEERISGVPMQLEKFSFGSLSIDGKTYEKDILIDCGEIRKRKKNLPSSFATASVTRRSQHRRRSPGNVIGS
jgi:hypothetical protein